MKALKFEDKRIEIHKVDEQSGKSVFLRHYDNRGNVIESSSIRYGGQDDTVDLIIDSTVPMFKQFIQEYEENQNRSSRY